MTIYLNCLFLITQITKCKSKIIIIIRKRKTKAKNNKNNNTEIETIRHHIFDEYVCYIWMELLAQLLAK